MRFPMVKTATEKSVQDQKSDRNRKSKCFDAELLIDFSTDVFLASFQSKRNCLQLMKMRFITLLEEDSHYLLLVPTPLITIIRNLETSFLSVQSLHLKIGVFVLSGGYEMHNNILLIYPDGYLKGAKVKT